jgi:hypothetical protein
VYYVLQELKEIAINKGLSIIIFIFLLFCTGCNLFIDVLGDGVDDNQDPTPIPTPVTTMVPTPGPTGNITTEPTGAPTVDGTPVPSTDPTGEVTVEPTPDSTAESTTAPTAEPTPDPTTEPTTAPTAEPTAEPTPDPTIEPTTAPTAEPTAESTPDPTAEPTAEPTSEPTAEPTAEPTPDPTAEPTPEPFNIIGQWAISDVTLPTSLVYDFRNDGICDIYEDYAMTLLYNSVSYTASETELDYGGTIYPLTVVSNDHFWVLDASKSLTIPMENPKKSTQTTRYTPEAYMDFYALGTEPGGHYENHFEKTALPINTGGWVTGSIDLYGDWIVYSFTAPATSNYIIEWDDALDGTEFYTLDIVTSCYQSDQVTPYFTGADNGYTSSQALHMNASETIYLIVMPYYVNEVGSYAIRITDGGDGPVYTIETFPNGGGSLADTYLILYDETLTLVSENDDNTGLYSRISYLVQSGMTYYIEVWDAHSKSDYYSLQVSTTGGGGSSSVVPSQTEGEQDNTYNKAVSIVTDTIYDRYLDPDESDWFVFTVP